MQEQATKRKEGGIYVLGILLCVIIGGSLDLMGYQKSALAVLVFGMITAIYCLNKDFPRSKK